MAGAHKITPSNPRIASLLADVTKGNIKIPVFQSQVPSGPSKSASAVTAETASAPRTGLATSQVIPSRAPIVLHQAVVSP